MTVEDQAPYINSADLVIWACGYQSNSIQITELLQNGKGLKNTQTPLLLSQVSPGTQFDVDNKCRVLLNNNIALNKIFGCGLGYPVRTNDGKATHGIDKREKASNPRADGFSLYMNIVADILLKNILPKDKIKCMSHKVYPIVPLAFQKMQISALKPLARLQKPQERDLQSSVIANMVNPLPYQQPVNLIKAKEVSPFQIERQMCFSAENKKRLIKSSQTISRNSKS
jgi:hypothetical protein